MPDTSSSIMDDTQSFWDDAVLVEPEDIHECNEANILPQEQDTTTRIRAWLGPTDFDGEGSEYQKHLSSHLSGTGVWLSNTSIYQQWHEDGKHGMLWIRGADIESS